MSIETHGTEVGRRARGVRPWVIGAVSAVGGAALVAGLVVLEPWSGGTVSPSPMPSASADASPQPSPTIRESATGHEAFAVDLWAASEIPWGEVGPGWFLLGFDPERSVPDSESGDDGWLLGSGETWLLSPEGDAFRGPQPPPEAEWISFWSGTVVWFATPNWETSCGEATCGEVTSIDVRTGEEGHPWTDEVLPGVLEATGTDSLLNRGGCCSAWVDELVDADGAVTSIAQGDVSVGSEGILTPDGTAYVWSEVIYDADWGPVSSEIRVRDLDGGEETVATLDRIAGTVGWIDETTVLLDVYRVTDDWEYVDRGLLTLDPTDGTTSPWVPPVEVYDRVTGLRPGVWLWKLSNSSDSVVTNNDGSLWIDLACTGSDWCYGQVSGDRLLWVDDTEGDTWEIVSQRLTLVDLTTGAQVVIFDGPVSNGKVVSIQPHAATY